MANLRFYHCLLILVFALCVVADDFWSRLERELSAKDEDEDEDDKTSDEEYEAWLDEQVDLQIALLESMFGVSEALTVAESPLGDLDEDFLEELVKSKRKQEVEENGEPSVSLPNNSGKPSQLAEKKEHSDLKAARQNDFESLIELAVNVLGSMVSEADEKSKLESRKDSSKKAVHSCLQDKIQIAKCSGDFQRWIVYKNGGFCRPNENGECQGVWYQQQEPADCVEICLYAPSAQEKKLSIRLAANSHSSSQRAERNESSYSY